MLDEVALVLKGCIVVLTPGAVFPTTSDNKTTDTGGDTNLFDLCKHFTHDLFDWFFAHKVLLNRGLNSVQTVAYKIEKVKYS